jgi:hypothetical protein
MRSIVALCVVLACAAASAGEVYKWKDKDGRIHYGDRPKHIDAAPVLINPDAVTTPNEQFASRQAREAECAKKTAQLENYKRAPSISEVDNLGKQREYTPAEREQFLAMQQQKVDALCAPPPSQAQSTDFPPPPPPDDPVQPPPEEPAPAN